MHTVYKPKVFYVSFLVKTTAFDQKCTEESQSMIEDLLCWSILCAPW